MLTVCIPSKHLRMPIASMQVCQRLGVYTSPYKQYIANILLANTWIAKTVSDSTAETPTKNNKTWILFFLLLVFLYKKDWHYVKLIKISIRYAHYHQLNCTINCLNIEICSENIFTMNYGWNYRWYIYHKGKLKSKRKLVPVFILR